MAGNSRTGLFAQIFFGLIIAITGFFTGLQVSGPDALVTISDNRDSISEHRNHDLQKIGHAGFNSNSSVVLIPGFNSSRFSGKAEAYRTGYIDGRDAGYSEGYSEASQKLNSLPYDPGASTQKPNEGIEIGEYNFVFGEIEGIYAGYSWPRNNTVKLEISELKTADDLETMCDHEVAHQLFPDFEHPIEKEKMFQDPIYRYSDDMEIKECDKLAKRLSLENSSFGS